MLVCNSALILSFLRLAKTISSAVNLVTSKKTL